MAAAGRSAPATRRRRRRGAARWSKPPRRRPPPPPASSPPPPGPDPPAPLPAGAEVEVRVDEPGFNGSWFEATVVGFAPARGARTPARYTVTYAHLLADDGGGVLAEHFAPTHVRPRPPPPDDSFPPRFRAGDIVEAFHHDGWWSGLVVAAPDSPDPGDAVTVAFPITREVIRFPPRLVRPRRDYVGGAWVPSRAAMAVRPRRAVRVYAVGDKVEVGRDRDVYGHSWFPATVARIVDDLSYVVEYFDLEEEGDGGPEKATEYLHWSFIRPAVEHLPRESEFRVGPGAAVEAYCDGAWSPGVVRRVVGDGEFEVSIVGKKAELLVTKVVELLKPQYKWNGKQWKIVTAKRWANLRRRSMLGQNLSSPVDVSSSGDDYSHDPESSGTKKSKKELQHAVLAENSEHASVSEIYTPLSALCKSPESNHSDSQLSEKNGLQVTSQGTVSSVPINGLCAPGHSTPQNESIPNSTGETVNNEEILTEMMDSDGHVNASGGEAHDMLSIAELRKNMASARRNSSAHPTKKKVLAVKSLKVKKGISKSKGCKTHPIQELQGRNDTSDNIQLKGNINFSSKDIVCALSVSVEGQTTKTLDRRVTRQTNRGSSTYKKLAKRKGHREQCSPLSSLDVTSTARQRGRKKVPGPMKESPLAEKLDNTLEDTLNVTEFSDQDMLPMIPPGFESMYDGKGVDIHGSLSEEEPPSMINNISQANINADACTDHATTQVANCNHLMETSILSVDHPVQEAGRKVDGRLTQTRVQNAGSSECIMDHSPLRSCSASGSSIMPSHLPVSQGHQVLFVKKSEMWHLVEARDVFKEVPQRPHFLPLRELSPALREGTALGLMVAFADLVRDIKEASIDHDIEWFEDKIGTLCYLEGNGFDVQLLQRTLTELLHIKSNRTSYLGEIHKLKAQIVGKTASTSRIDALLDEKDRAIAELEQKLGRLRQESQKIAKDKDLEEVELFRLKAARSRIVEAYSDAEQQFRNTLAKLHQKKLT
ncbi:uncharacterized protein C2845_PM18G09260 [Panicum miliaceum]|uniref:Agenet domain-containing protein n=1 Tax=Panicum miliaceum TaxID=4540 RepID=A0A3L6PJH5_PANMI|nr:uncharacterized protein C2845_PM18G09260 [Panicum miliaceum]